MSKTKLNNVDTNFYYTSIARSYLYNLDDNIIYNNLINKQLTTFLYVSKLLVLSMRIQQSLNVISL